MKAKKEQKEVKKERSKLSKIFELVIFSSLLTLLIAPGLFYTDVIAHEFYHYIKHQDITEEICIDVNKPYWGHVKVDFGDQEELLKYETEQLTEEERKANIFGHIASVIYLLNAVAVVNWMLILIVKRQREK